MIETIHAGIQQQAALIEAFRDYKTEDECDIYFLAQANFKELKKLLQQTITENQKWEVEYEEPEKRREQTY